MIYCKNTECKFNKKLDKPINFRYSKYSTPFDDNLVEGSCRIIPLIKAVEFNDINFKIEQPTCNKSEGICQEIDCAHNENGSCIRDDIMIDISLISHEFICKCFSNKSISGHVDWFKNLNSDGTSKGGHISDSEAMKIKRK
jgi:hypothetical protein